jgi:hypothetical protein
VYAAAVAGLGDDTEQGIPTTRYRAELASGDGAAAAPVVTIEIGSDDGLVRMLAVRSEGSASARRLVLRFAKFGVDVDVKEPPGALRLELEQLRERR